jgi:predicted membrane metal-binding protein
MKSPALCLVGILAAAALAAVLRIGIVILPIAIIGSVVFCVHRKSTVVPILIGLLFFCFTFLHAALILNHTTDLDEYNNTDVTVTVQAIGYPEYTEGRSRALFRILEVDGLPDYDQNDKILLSVYASDSVTITPGSVYRVTGRLKVPESETNPGGFDYNFYLKTQNVFLTMWTQDDTFTFVQTDSLPFHFDKLLQVRSDCVSVIERFLPDEEGNVLSSMSVWNG